MIKVMQTMSARKLSIVLQRQRLLSLLGIGHQAGVIDIPPGNQNLNLQSTIESVQVY